MIMLLLGKGPTDLKLNLSDWTTEDFEGKTVLFYQGKSYIPKDYNLRKRLSPNTMTFYLLDILGKSRPLMLSRSIIGGQECRPSSGTMSKSVEYFKINWNLSNPLFNLILGPMTTQPFANLSMDLITDLPLIDYP